MTSPAAATMSRKQLSVVAEALDHAVTIFEGSIRAGKTFSWLLLIVWMVMNAGTRGSILIVGKNRDSIFRNVFEPLDTEPVFAPFRHHITYRQGAPTARMFGRTVHVIGANDAGAESRIRGLTVQLAFADEITVLHVAFFKQLLGRMSVPGAKFVGTTNPDSPNHWLRKDYLRRVPGCSHFDPDTAPDDRLVDWHVAHFTMDDNPSLDDAYKQRMRREYSGLWYDRFIRGLWVAAEGAIYDMWNPAVHVMPRDEMPPMHRVIALGMDYGTTNPTTGVMVAIGDDGRLYVIDEWAPGSGKTDAQLADDLEAWLDTVPAPEWLFLDPAAASFAMELYQRGHTNLADATNTVLDGIRTVASLLSRHKLVVAAHCTNLIGEITGYRWDTKASGKGEDKPVKEHDHHCVAAGALVETERGPVPIEQVRAGDRVWTRQGLREVLWSGQTGVRPTMTLTTRTGRTLTATDDHPVWSFNSWQRMDTLRYGDKLVTWEDAKSSCSTVSDFDGTPTHNVQPTAATSHRESRISSAVPDASTKKYGCTTTGSIPFPPGITSTTSTTTWTTTTIPTSKLSPLRNIADTMRHSRGLRLNARSLSRTPHASSRSRGNGTSPRKAWRTIARMANGRGRALSAATWCANSAGRPTPPNADRECARGSVQTPASPHGDEHKASTTSTANAGSAVRRSASISTQSPATAHDAVEDLRDASSAEPVFNLAVEGEHEFFANGILVHNCDALRYAVMSTTHFWQPYILEAP